MRALLFACLVSGALPAAEWSHRGEAAFEGRVFKNDHVKTTNDEAFSAFTRVESGFTPTDEGRLSGQFRGFARLDQKNTSRNILAPEDLYLDWGFGENRDTHVFAGYRLFNWTATEAFHPADVVNSRNFDSDLENLEKIGEMVVGVERRFPAGELGLYFFPHYQRPRYPGRENRLGVGADVARPKWVDGEGGDGVGDDWGAQVGAKWAQSFAGADLMLFAVRHMDRSTPSIGTANFARTPGGVVPLDLNFAPYYYTVVDYGLTYQQAVGDLLIKAESTYKDFLEEKEIYTLRGLRLPDDHGATAVGLEYGHALESGQELSFFLEGQGLWSASKSQRAEMNVFQRDVMLGTRLALNDVMGTEFMLSGIMDVERSHEYLGNFAVMRRLSDQWKGKLGVRYYDAPGGGPLILGLQNLNRDHHIFFALTRYF